MTVVGCDVAIHPLEKFRRPRSPSARRLVKTMGYPTINNSSASTLNDMGYDVDSGNIKDDCRWVKALM